MSKVNIKKIYKNCKNEIDYGIVDEALLNEWSLKGLKDKAKSLAGKVKDKAVELKNKAVDKAKEVKKNIDDKGGIKKVASDVAKKTGDALGKAADVVSKKAGDIKKDVDKKGFKAVAKDALGKAKEKIVGKKAEFDNSKKYTKDDIINKVKKMDKLGAINFIAQEMNIKPSEVITLNIGDISSKTIKKMGSAVANFGKELGGTFSKNLTDANKDVDASKIDFDERKSRFSCVFDGEDGKNILEIAKKMEEQLKQAPKLADNVVQLTEKDLKAKGVKDVSKEDIENNTTLIAAAIEDNKSLKGDKLEGKIESAIDKKDGAKKDDSKETDEAEHLNESGNTFGKIFNTFAGLFGKEAGTKVTDTKHIRAVSAWMTHTPGYSYENIEYNIKDKSTSLFSSYGKIPGGLWWLPLAMIGKIAWELKDNIIKAVGSTYLKYKDKKGVIAEMEFYVNKIKYSARFSTDDFKWHCVNVKDAKVKVSDDILNAALNSKLGNKFKKHCIDIWGKLFKSEEGKAAPFKIILDNADQLEIKGKELKQLKVISDNYAKIADLFKSEATESMISEKIKLPTKEELGKKIVEILKKMAFNKAIQTLNKLSGGKFIDAVIDVYDEKVVSKYNDKKLTNTAKKIFDTHPEVAKAEKKEDKEKEIDSRDDSNTSTDIDAKTYKFSCMFEGEVGKKIREVILNMNKDSMDATKKVEQALKDTEALLKKAGVKPEDAKAFGPAAAALLDAGKKPEEIKKEIDKAGKDVKESCNRYMKLLKKNNSRILTESMKSKKAYSALKLQILNESVKQVNYKYITEGFLTSLFGKTVETSDAMASVHTYWSKGSGLAKNTADALGDIMNADNPDINAADRLIHGLSNGHAAARAEWKSKVVGPAIQGTNILSAWAPLIVAGIIGVAYKYRKQINQLIDRGMLRYKNSKEGTIAEVNFKTTGAKTEYKTYFNIKSFVWRCRNLANIAKQPSEELLKASLDSDLGKKFREYCKKTWDPIFNSTENDKLAVNFSEMLKEPDKYGFDKKTTGYLKDFVNNYNKIEEACLSDNYKFDIKLSDEKLK